MKKLFFAFCLLISVISIKAQSNDELLYEAKLEPCSVGSYAKFYAYTFDNVYYLVLAFQDSGKNNLITNCIVKFKMNDGSVLKLTGVDRSIQSSSSAVHFGFGYSVASSSDTHYAVFPISQEEINLFQGGVSKVAINTIPVVYERSQWSGKKKFGQRIYEAFKIIKKEFDD
jgi:hypothetical protein